MLQTTASAGGSGAGSLHSSLGDFQQQLGGVVTERERDGQVSQMSSASTTVDGRSQHSGQELASVMMSASSTLQMSKEGDGAIDWRPPFPRLCAYHDCNSLAAAWGIGPPTINIESAQPTGASMAQSPAAEDDAGDGKSNDLLASCPAFRYEYVRGERLNELDLEVSSEESRYDVWHCQGSASPN